MKTKTLGIFLGLILALVTLVVPTAGQDTRADSSSPASASKLNAAYQLDFKLSEIEDGKKINSRSYSMLAQAGGVLSKLRLGARVPVPTGGFRSDTANALVNTQYQYMEAGMNIDCRIQEQEGALALNVTVDSSSFTHPAQDNPIKQPVMNQLKFDLSTIVGIGRPTVISTADDPSSKRQFQLEVTATKVK